MLNRIYFDQQVPDFNLQNIETEAIKLAFIQSQGKRKEMARLLGISERTLYRKLGEQDLHHSSVEDVIASMEQ